MLMQEWPVQVHKLYNTAWLDHLAHIALIISYYIIIGVYWSISAQFFWKINLKVPHPKVLN